MAGWANASWASKPLCQQRASSALHMDQFQPYVHMSDADQLTQRHIHANTLRSLRHPMKSSSTSCPQQEVLASRPSSASTRAHSTSANVPGSLTASTRTESAGILRHRSASVGMGRMAPSRPSSAGTLGSTARCGTKSASGTTRPSSAGAAAGGETRANCCRSLEVDRRCRVGIEREVRAEIEARARLHAAARVRSDVRREVARLARLEQPLAGDAPSRLRIRAQSGAIARARIPEAFGSGGGAARARSDSPIRPADGNEMVMRW